MAQEPLKQWNSKLPESLIEELKRQADQEGITATQLLTKAVRFYLSKAPAHQSSVVDAATYENRLNSLEQQLEELLKKVPSLNEVALLRQKVEALERRDRRTASTMSNVSPTKPIKPSALMDGTVRRNSTDALEEAGRQLKESFEQQKNSSNVQAVKPSTANNSSETLEAAVRQTIEHFKRQDNIKDKDKALAVKAPDVNVSELSAPGLALAKKEGDSKRPNVVLGQTLVADWLTVSELYSELINRGYTKKIRTLRRHLATALEANKLPDDLTNLGVEADFPKRHDGNPSDHSLRWLRVIHP